MSEESKFLGRQCLNGDPTAERQVFERYLRRLTGLARKRLAPIVGKRVDPEDAVQSAFRSFFLGARSGKFALEDGDGLWQLLATITARKAARTNQRHAAARRDVRKEHVAVSPPYAMASDLFTSRSSAPEEAATLADELSAVMASLTPDVRAILEMRLQDASTDEIADRLGKSPRTIRRYLDSLRDALSGDHDDRRVATPSSIDSESDQGNLRRVSSSQQSTVDYRDLVLQSHLGTGGVGKVYRAWRRGDEATFALKVLKKSFAHHRAAIKCFQNEYEIMAGWRHPGIVNVYGLGQTPGGTYFYLMDLLPGRSLAELRPAEYDARQVRTWLRQIVGAITFAHSRGVVHCDLKPSNILLNAAGEAVIVDFGFARFMERNATSIGGTPAFAAPELLDGSLTPVAPAIDVWGIGAVLYWLVYGRPPQNKTSTEPPRIHDALLKSICEQALREAPIARPTITELERLLNSM